MIKHTIGDSSNTAAITTLHQIFLYEIHQLAALRICSGDYIFCFFICI
jgi:hypothetical protein